MGVVVIMIDLELHGQSVPITTKVASSLWRGVLNATLYDKVCQSLATGRWFSPGTPDYSTNKTDRHVITEILLKASQNTINQTYFANTSLCKLCKKGN
jgi:hypothetical protein